MGILDDTKCKADHGSFKTCDLPRDCLQILFEIGLPPGSNLDEEKCQDEAPRILIVEDECIIAAHLECSLKGFGYNVMGVARMGQEAVAMAATSQVDLVLMDVHLSGDMDGIEAASAIRSRSEVAIVYVIGDTSSAMLSRAEETYPYGYLFKPFSERSLNTVIEVALRSFRKEKRLKHCSSFLWELFDACPLPMIVNRKDTILLANPAAVQSVGAETHEKLMGRPLAETLSQGCGMTAPVKRGKVEEEGGERCPSWKIVPLHCAGPDLSIAYLHGARSMAKRRVRASCGERN